MSIEDNIFKHIKNDYNRQNQLSSCNGVRMNVDLKNILFYNASFKKCQWFDCDLTNSSANGNVFSENNFHNSHIDNVSMEYCRFSEDIFHNCTFRGSNFTHSTFHYSALEDCEIHGCSFMEALFSHAILRNNKISSSNFELCRFQDTHLESMNLSSLNLRYSFFENVVMHKVTLPFLQMPYTFNGLQFVFQTDDEIDFESREKNENGTISYKRYTHMLPDFITFFKNQQEYFPLANCYNVQGDNKRAQESNEAGIKQCVLVKDFRSLYYYCLQLACILKCSHEDRVEIYKKINRDMQSISLSPAEYYQFGYYFPMIKKLLFDNPVDSPTLSVSMKTNIEPSDYEKLGYFLHLLEELKDSTTLHFDGQHIEVRRNSPAVIDWLTSGGAETLFILLKDTYSALQPILQDTANVMTILGLTLLGNKVTMKPIKEEKSKTSSVANKSNTTTSANHSEIKTENKNGEDNEGTYETTMLRDEIYNLFHVDTKDVPIQSFKSGVVTSLDTKKEQLAQWVSELKKRGIQILDFDAQILNSEKNILDHLYRQFFDQYYQGNI